MTSLPTLLQMEAGATFAFGFNWYKESVPATVPPTPGVAYNLLAPPAHGQMMVREKKETEVIFTISTDGPTPAIRFNAGGRVDILIPGSVTGLLAVKSAVYDLEITLGTPLIGGEPDIRRVISGPVKNSLGVTHG
jgi:hypothetical protein